MQNGGSARAYLARLVTSSAFLPSGFHSRMACVACIFIRATLCRECPHLAPLYVKEGVLRGRRAGVAWWVAGPGSDLSEVPAMGLRPAALDVRAAPTCPPGSASCWLSGD